MAYNLFEENQKENSDGYIFAETQKDVSGTYVFAETQKEDSGNSVFAETQKENQDEMGIFRGNGGEGATVTIKGQNQDYTFVNVTESRRGSGNQASIYNCKGTQDKEEYAIKLYNPEAIDIKKLLPTLEVLKNNNHPNVTNIIEHGNCSVLGKEYYYAVMDIYEPIDRNAYMWKNADSKDYRNLILTFIDDMNEALRFIHKNGVLHCDIKPNNIMINPKTKKITLIDFGGAVKRRDFSQSSVVAAAATARYSAPETVKNVKTISKYSEYYLLGVSLAELIDGIYPGDEKTVKQSFGNVKNIHMYRVPANLPDYYENILRGLLFEDDDTDRRTEHRWVGEKVDAWIEAVRRNDLVRAATMNNVPRGVVVKEKKVEDQWSFGGSLTLEVGEDEIPYTFTSLTEMADEFLTVDLWDDGIGVLLEGDSFSENNVKSDILKLINKGTERMQNVGVNNGHSVNAEYFKFLYKYVSDKSVFCWKDLPEVKNVEDFAMELGDLLEEIQDNNGRFGEWWIDMTKENRAESTAFAEIFRNSVLSFYLNRASVGNKELIEQCKKVERIFQNLKENYTTEELVEMFTLQRMLLNDTSYEFPSGKSYDTYEEFKKDLAIMASDGKRVDEITEIIKNVKNKNGCKPAFTAWKNMQKG